MNEIIICDLDGTIALDNGRAKECLHSGKKDWATYFDRCTEDLPNQKLIDLLKSFSQVTSIWILSGRVQRTRVVTLNWLRQNDVPFRHLVMRADEDRTDDHLLKLRWAQEFGFTPESVWFVLEDRDRVVEAWRLAGFTCFQVAHGTF